jgi:hypothetical protein
MATPPLVRAPRSPSALTPSALLTTATTRATDCCSVACRWVSLVCFPLPLQHFRADISSVALPGQTTREVNGKIITDQGKAVLPGFIVTFKRI